MQTARPQVILILLLASIALPDAAWSSDACSTRAVVSQANVTSSDGLAYSAITHFRSSDAAAVTLIGESTRSFAVEGPLGWAAAGERAETSEDQYKAFALGHQYHALLLYFDEIASNTRPAESIRLHDRTLSGVSGDYPYGGLLHLVHGDRATEAAGIILELPDAEPIVAVFSDWREIAGRSLPFSIDIDDGQREFSYRYSEIDVQPAEIGWFEAAVAAPPSDTVQLYRLHRLLLAAHCLGDAPRMAELSAAEILVASRGELSTVSNAAMQAQFEGLFRQLDYVAYTDLIAPVIEVADSGDIGWIAVNTRAEGVVISNGDRFDNQWAWVMLARKTGGVWRHAGTASNVAR